MRTHNALPPDAGLRRRIMQAQRALAIAEQSERQARAMHATLLAAGRTADAAALQARLGDSVRQVRESAAAELADAQIALASLKSKGVLP